ncbi:ATP-binding protein [Streptomyces sp. NPDC046759]|uniref:ATP-binding protein n=1 Tax=Streptomyces sp. NPDC046759 TaxID=3155019 RepID=UPI0033CBF22C
MRRRATIFCPYDTSLPEHALAQAHGTHPVVGSPDGYRHSPPYTDPYAVCGDCDLPLPEPEDPLVLHFGQRDLGKIRDTVGDWGESAGLWCTADTAVAEVRDRGRLTDPLTGRRRPDPSSPGGGRGVWMMHQFCDLVKIRTRPSGLVVRLHVALE